MRSINLRRSNSRREVQVPPVNAARSLDIRFQEHNGREAGQEATSGSDQAA
jgi:hypothetical protein